MAEHLKFERYCWFNTQIRADRYPNASSLAHQFETCRKTAQRTINYMRDRLLAPLEYDQNHRGYHYTESSFNLPYLPVTQNELLAILLARNLLSHSAGGVISNAISSFGNKLLAETGELGLGKDRLEEGFSAAWNGYTPSEGSIFETVAGALIQKRQIAFRYYSPQNNEWTVRNVDPHHLQHYNGSWILLAWCHLRNRWSKFHLARIDNLSLTDQTFTPILPATWQNQIQGAFGIFQGGEPREVALRFTPYRTRWVRKEIWHPDQINTFEKDGSLLMRFVVTDFREVKLRILQYGSEVEVVEPNDLREEIIREIGLMAQKYGGG